MPLDACETGVCRTTSAGVRVKAGAACDIQSIVAHRSQGIPARPLKNGVPYTVMPSQLQMRAPLWYMIPVRALFVTFLLTLLSFAVTLLLSILGLVIRGWARGISPDMRFAYRHVAMPVAIVAGAIILVLMLVLEIRHYRASKALAGIARASR